MKRFWTAKKLSIAAVACFAASMQFCAVGCGDDVKTGIVYRYEGSSFTDSYNLYEDGSYEREYKGLDYARITLETGTYTTNSSVITFYIKDSADIWTNNAPAYNISAKSYSGTLRNEILTLSYDSLSNRTYEKHGTIRKK